MILIRTRIMVEANKADDSGKDNGQFEDLIDGKLSKIKYFPSLILLILTCVVV